MIVSIPKGLDLRRLLEERKQKPLLATRVAELDRLYDGGLRRGAFIEMYGDPSSGRFALTLASLAAATQIGETAALIDLGDHLDPQAAEAAGIDLRRLLWVRPLSVKAALLSAEMTLAAGFSLVALNINDASVSAKEYPAAVWMRLARTAEEHKAIFLTIHEKPIGTVAAGVRVKAERASTVWPGVLAYKVFESLTVNVTVQKRKDEWGERTGRLTFQSSSAVGHL